MKCKTCKNKEAVTGTGQCKKCWRKDYRVKNREHIRKVSHARYLKVREQRLAHWKEKYYENPQHFLAMAKKSRMKNHDKIKSKWGKAYEKYKTNQIIRAETRRKFKHLLKSGECQTCGTKERLTFHHPTQPYRYDVFQILCRKCHGNLHGQKHFSFDEKPEGGSK